MLTKLIAEIDSWINSDSIDREEKKIREILGNISTEINHASILFLNAHIYPTIENKAVARNILDAINQGQFNHLHTILPKVQDLISHSFTQSQKPILINMIHMIEKSYFNQKQIEQLEKITEISNNKNDEDDDDDEKGFPELINKEGMAKHLKSSIYDTKEEKDKTLKVIREVLQNAVDATDPKQHPHLTNRENFNPEISITTKYYSGANYMDIMIEDKGIGMDWETMRKKFFIVFDSGKRNIEGSTGGFGVAKALIQEAPIHGWSIDTNNVHSNRFQKNIYASYDRPKNYPHLTSEIRKESDGGVTLSLFGLPLVDSSKVTEYCEKYATNGRIKIILNKKLITPLFVHNSPDLKSLDNLNNLVNVFDKENLRNNAEGILVKFKDGIEDSINNVNLVSNQFTNVKFFVRNTNKSYGTLYVMVNSQFQFEKEQNFSKIDLICSIETSAKPGSEDYPLDPGRNFVRGKLGATIDQAVAEISDFAKKVGNDELFKQGIDTIQVNSQSSPMSTHVPQSKIKNDELVNSMFNDLDKMMFKPPAKTTAELGQENEPNEPIKTWQDILDAYEKATGKSLDSTQKNMADTLAKDLAKKDKITVKDIKQMVEGLETPAAIMIQRNFVAKEWVNKNVHLTSEILIVWQKSLKIIVEKMTSTTFGKQISDRDFIPGLIFSDECNGVYVPKSPDDGRPYDSISINPITIASSINPKLFTDRLKGKEYQDAFITASIENKNEDNESDSTNGDTPINRVSKLIFHIATHEICHLLYPDHMWNPNKNFHDKITYLEIVCHDCYFEIRDEVKEFMKGLRINSSKLINAIAKHGRKDESKINSLIKYNESSNISYKKEKIKNDTKSLDFSDWFYGWKR